MKFVLLGLGNLAENREVIETAIIEADELGFNLALMPDHYMWGSQIQHGFRHPYHTLETWSTLTYLSAKTNRIRLGTLVTPLSLRHPAILAKMLSTLDNLSNGRVVLGVGAGWSRVEFEGYSEWSNEKVRVDKTVEALKIIKRLWTEPEVTHEGKFYSVKKAVLEPKPVQRPYPTLLFGSQGERMLRLTGQYGNICFIPPWASEKRGMIKKTVSEAATKAGRVDEIAFMEGIMAPNLSFNTEDYMKIVESAESHGALYCTIAFPRDNMIQSMKNFATEIMPSYI